MTLGSSGSEAGRISSFAPTTIILDVDHGTVSDIEHLVKVLLSLREVNRHDNLVRNASFDLHLDARWIDSRLPERGDLSFENRPGLVRPVSEGRRPCPQTSTRHSTPVDLGVEQRDELFCVALKECLVAIPDASEVRRLHDFMLHRGDAPVNRRAPCLRAWRQ